MIRRLSVSRGNGIIPHLELFRARGYSFISSGTTHQFPQTPLRPLSALTERGQHIERGDAKPQLVCFWEDYPLGRVSESSAQATGGSRRRRMFDILIAHRCELEVFRKSRTWQLFDAVQSHPDLREEKRREGSQSVQTDHYFRASRVWKLNPAQDLHCSNDDEQVDELSRRKAALEVEQNGLLLWYEQ